MATDIEFSAEEHDQDTWIETLLREDAEDARYLEDSGFTARVMTALPAARDTRRYRWVVPLMALLGVLIGGVWLSGFIGYVEDLQRIAAWDALSLGRALQALAPVALLYWYAVSAAWQQD